MFVTEYTTRIEFENGQWVDIRPLSWLEMEKASYQAQVDAVQAAKDLDIDRILEGASDEDIAAVQDRLDADPLALLDELLVLKAGIVAWSAEVPLDEAHIRLLEPAVARKLAVQIVGLRDKDGLGNSSSPSTPS